MRESGQDNDWRTAELPPDFLERTMQRLEAEGLVDRPSWLGRVRRWISGLLARFTGKP